MRFLGALSVAVVVVSGMLLLGLRLSGFMEAEQTRSPNLHNVEVLTEAQSQDLAELLADADNRVPPAPPLFSDLPPLQVEE